MFSPKTYQARRQALAKAVGKGYIFILGNEEAPKNYTDNVYHFRQDSSFLYFCGIDKPGYALGIDLATGKSCLFGEDITIDHIVWMGDQPSLRDLADRSGIDEIASPDAIASVLKSNKDNLHFLPPYRALNGNKLKGWLGESHIEPSRKLIEGVIDLRSYKSEEELFEIEKAVALTRDMHHYVRDHAKPGLLESELSGPISGMAMSQGGDLAYGVILTINGQIL
ncbi:MAG: aminopeptidase P family protein, partial [Saprospiraceae bacterium]|nr:aminopeptidase P family protein [Saprospiraceae bacterium]